MLATDLPLAVFRDAQRHVAVHARRTPLLGSASLSAATGFDVHLKAESFKPTGT